MKYLHVVHFHSTVLDVVYLHLWKQYDAFVHIKSSLYYRYNLSRTHFARLIRNLYIVHFHSTILDVYYLHLWKQYDVFVHIKSYLYYRYNLSRTQLWDWWGIFTLFPFTLQYWMSINYTYEGNMMFVHIKSSLYYRFNLIRTHFARLIRNLYIFHFHSTRLNVYYLHLWKQYDVFVHIKFHCTIDIT